MARSSIGLFRNGQIWTRGMDPSAIWASGMAPRASRSCDRSPTYLFTSRELLAARALDRRRPHRDLPGTDRASIQLAYFSTAPLGSACTACRSARRHRFTATTTAANRQAETPSSRSRCSRCAVAQGASRISRALQAFWHRPRSSAAAPGEFGHRCQKRRLLGERSSVGSVDFGPSVGIAGAEGGGEFVPQVVLP